MSDKKYSVDDILEEYSQKKDFKSKSKGIELDIDELLIDKNKSDKKPIQLNNKNNIQSPRFKKNSGKKSEDTNELKFERIMETSELSFQDKGVKPLRKKSGNTDLILGLKKIVSKKATYRTVELTPINRKGISDIDLDIDGKIIPKTQTLTLSDEATEEEKIDNLNKIRKNKIKDFILHETIENFDDEDIEPVEEKLNFNDYDTIDDAPLIFKALNQLKAALSIRFLILIFLFLFSGYSVIAAETSLPLIPIINPSNNPIAFLFVNVILGLIAALISYTVMASGLKNIIKFKADADSLSASVMIISLIAPILMFENPDLLQRGIILSLYIPMAILCLIFNTLGKLLSINQTLQNFKYITSESEKYALFHINDENTANRLTKGAISDFPRLCSMKKTEFITNFLKNSYNENPADNFCKYLVPSSIIAGLISAVFSVLFVKEPNLTTFELSHIAFTAIAGTVSITSCFAVMLVASVPMSNASKKCLRSSSALIGYSAIEEFKKTNSILIDINTLFPEGTVDFVNLKQISALSIEEGILYAASLTSHANSILKSTFYKMLKGKTEMLYPIDSYIYEDGLGISGWIDNKRVLFGTRELMEDHSIEGLPSKSKESQYVKGNDSVLYLSISGEVTTLFIVKTKISLGVKKWLQEIEKEGISVVMHSVDAFISLSYLSELFDISPEFFRLLPFRNHSGFDEITTYQEKINSPLICSGKFQPFALALITAKRLYKTIRTGIGFMTVSAILGSVIAVIFSLMSSLSQLTCGVVIIYHLIWTILVLIFQSIKKTP